MMHSMFPLLTLTGTPYERGVQHGRAFAGKVRHSVASYARLFAYFRGLNWAQVQTLAADYEPLLRTVAPHLLDEMRGIAAGAEMGYPEILALNVRTELLAGRFAQGRHVDYAAAVRINRAAGVPQHPEPAVFAVSDTPDMDECTTVATQQQASADQHVWLAQNWDWTGDQRDACVLLKIHEPGKADILTLAEAGMLAKIGINSAGIAVTLNILASKLDGKQPGMPVHVQLRLMLECENFEAARASAEQIPSGASSCITLASASGELAALEITPAGVGALAPEEGALAHSNHCISAIAAGNAAPLAKTSTTLERYDRARVMLDAHSGAATRDSLIAILRDQSNAPSCICRHPNLELHPCERTESVAGVVMDLTARIMYVAPGVPSDVDFVPVALR
jgi:isopenicillin-N N-acyltransferase like protein